MELFVTPVMKLFIFQNIVKWCVTKLFFLPVII